MGNQCTACTRTMTDTAYLCHACTGRLRSSLRAIRALLEELETTAARLSRQGEAVGGRSSEKPLPINLHAADQRTEIVAILHGWARCLWEESGSPEEHAPAEPVGEWLAARVDAIRLREWAPDAFSEIEGHAATGWTAVDLPPETVCLGHCTCGQPLRAPVGKTTVRCPDQECGATHDVQERRDRMLAASDDMELPAATIARALEVTPAAIRGWAHWDSGHGGWFAACTVDRSGRPRYRLGDARRRLAQARAASIAVSAAS